MVSIRRDLGFLELGSIGLFQSNMGYFRVCRVAFHFGLLGFPGTDLWAYEHSLSLVPQTRPGILMDGIPICFQEGGGRYPTAR